MIELSRSRWSLNIFWRVLAALFVVSCAGAPSGHWFEDDEVFAGVHSATVNVYPVGSEGFSDESRKQFDEMRKLVRQRASAALRSAGIRVIEAIPEYEELGRLPPGDRLHHAALTFKLSFDGPPSSPSYAVSATSRQTVTLGRNPNSFATADIGFWWPTVSGSRWGRRSFELDPRFETVLTWLQRDVDSILEQIFTPDVTGAESVRGAEYRQRADRWDWLMDVADKGIIGFIVGGFVALGMLAKAYVKRKLLKRKDG